MKISRISWTTFFFLSIISLAIWLKYSYPQLVFSNFSIDRQQAVAIARDFLQKKGDVNTDDYTVAAIFGMDRAMDQYAQKTIGFEGLKNFIKQHGFDLFFWRVRFFRENEKEEYHFIIDSAKGEITGYSHVIDDNEARPMVDKEVAKERAREFLSRNFGFQPENFTIASDLSTVHDNRTDYFFSWYRVDVNIPWSDEANSGTGKLIKSVKITGDEILGFSKNTFLVPDQFNRDLQNQGDLGSNIMIAIQIISLLLLISGIFLIIVRQNHLAMHTTKRFYFGIMIISFTLSLLGNLNQFQQILYSYNTTVPFNAFLWRTGISTVIGALFITVAILIPSLAGELLHFEATPPKKTGSFLYYIQSTFASRHVSALIALGYFVCFIMLGMQSLLVHLGQTHLGVWIGHSWVNDSSASYLPFLAALTFGYKTAFSEEIMYRLYAINLGKKIFSKFALKSEGMNLVIIALAASLIWGFAHSSYPIYPMWFRGLEVSCLGIFIAFIYLNFGIIPVIVAHFLFDVFWNCAGFIFGTTQPYYFYSSVFVLLLPLTIGIIAFFMNKPEKLRPLRWRLNNHQLYNLEILKVYLTTHQSTYALKPKDQIKREITSHGWDPAVVEMAIEDLYGQWV